MGLTHKQIQEQRFQKDIRENPGTIDEYRGIVFETKRPYGSYLCGYLYCKERLSENVLNMLDRVAHGGLTDGLGFDCAHFGDYIGAVPPFMPVYRETGTYRDHDYVVAILKKMIDVICTLN